MASATTTPFETYMLYAAASTNGISQINHAASGKFKVMFLTASYTVVNEHSVEAQLTANEATGSGGYTVGGHDIENVTFTLGASGTATFDGDNVIVTASGGDLSARYMAVIASVATSSDRRPLMFLIDPGQVETAGDGTTFNINWSADGIVQVKPG
jgi:hypothetical protein